MAGDINESKVAMEKETNICIPDIFQGLKLWEPVKLMSREGEAEFKVFSGIIAQNTKSKVTEMG